MDWWDNDDLFRSEVAEGHKWERRVAEKLAEWGFEVQIGPQTVRESAGQIKDYAKELDLLVEGLRCEVKSRRLTFGGPSDYPYDDAIVDTVFGFDKKQPEPHLCLCVSQPTGFLIGLPVKRTRPQWTSRHTYDRFRQIEVLNYYADKGLWLNEASLKALFNGIKARRDQQSAVV